MYLFTDQIQEGQAQKANLCHENTRGQLCPNSNEHLLVLTLFLKCPSWCRETGDPDEGLVLGLRKR